MANIEFCESLAAVQERFKNYNLLLPTATDVQLNPFYKYRIEIVPVDLSENSGDVFKVGSVDTGRKDANGKSIWVDEYALLKPVLNRMAMRAGIQFSNDSYGERIDQYTYRAHAYGAIRRADGTIRTEVDQKEICLLDEEEKFRIEFGDKAAKGISDNRQAKIAAEMFKGKWIKMRNKWGSMVDGYLIDEEDRERYIQRSVMVNMSQLRKSWAEKAMTGAKLRVIRALLGLKGKYTREELSRSFAITSVIFSPDYNNPQVFQAMLAQGIGSVNNMFGVSGIPVKQISFEDETVEMDVEADATSAAFRSDMVEDPADDYRQPDPPENIPPAEEAPAQEERQSDYVCDECGCEISEKVYAYSLDRMGRPLCIKCQKRGGGR